MEGLWAVAELPKKVTQTFTLQSENKELDGIVDSHSFLRLHWLLSSNFKNSFLHPFTSLTWVMSQNPPCLSALTKPASTNCAFSRALSAEPSCRSATAAYKSSMSAMERCCHEGRQHFLEKISSFGIFDVLASTSPRWYNNIPGSKVNEPMSMGTVGIVILGPCWYGAHTLQL